MPPENAKLAQEIRSILSPGDRVVRNAAGEITDFGKFKVSSTPEKIQQGVVIGVYASGGTGKTTFFCSIADRKLNPEGHDLPMLMLDAEGGVKSVIHLIGSDLHHLPIHSFYEIEEWIEVARAQPKANFPWRSVYLDNLSDMIQKALFEQGLHGKPNAGPGMTSSQPDYGAMTTRVTLALQNLRDLALDYNFNLFISLWEAVEKTSGGDIIGYRADITPKLAIRVQGILDYIGYLSVLKTQAVIKGIDGVSRAVWVRKLDFSPNPELDSKWRVTPDKAEQIPLELYNPLLPPILDTIKRGVPFPTNQFKKVVSPTTQK